MRWSRVAHSARKVDMLRKCMLFLLHRDHDDDAGRVRPLASHLAREQYRVQMISPYLIITDRKMGFIERVECIYNYVSFSQNPRKIIVIFKTVVFFFNFNYSLFDWFQYSVFTSCVNIYW